MKKMYNFWLLFALLAVVACSDDDSNDVVVDEEVVASPGSADFSNYVSLGNSLTAGFADGALFIQGQEGLILTYCLNNLLWQAAANSKFR